MLVEEGYLLLKKLEGKKISDVDLVNKGSDGHQLKDKYMAFYFKKDFLNCFI